MRFAASTPLSAFTNRPDYGSVGSMGVLDSAQTDVNTALNNARTAGEKMRSIAAVESAKANAEAIRAGGQARGQASAVSGIAGAVGGLGGIFKSGFGGGGGGSSYGSSSFSSSFGGFNRAGTFDVPSTFNSPL